jgi:DNA-binding transcriptional LysR family regulator
MLERHEIEAFVTLAEELHFGRTAERLHVSTARVSQAIKRMELRVGVPLFERTSRRVELTDAGRALLDEVGPAWQRITAAVERAGAAPLEVAFVGAAGGQLLAGAAGLLDAEVRIREAQLGDVLPWLRDRTVDIVLSVLPVQARGLVSGPVLVSEPRMLAVPAGHALARRDAVSVADLRRVELLRLPETVPRSLRAELIPDGQPLAAGPPAATLNELLMLVGAGAGVFPVGAQTRRYYARPDVSYVAFSDAPPLRWGLVWRTDRADARVRAFARAAASLTAASGR